ncbi:MAG: M23 family metallopeptidase, partial [Patescibacteria group bacterium]
GLTTAAGGALGFLSGAANFVVGGLSSLVVPASAAAIPVAGGISAVAVGGTIVGIVTATTFFNPESEVISPGPPNENQFLILDKTANPTQMATAGGNITFTITLTAKVELEGVKVIDRLNVQTKDKSFSVDRDINGKPISLIPCPPSLAAGQVCTYVFEITTDAGFQDSIVTNTAEVTAIPKNQPLTSAHDTATVIIGNPPAACPRGWPAVGEVTQGPEGSFSHSSPQYGEYEALDTAQSMGNRVYATVEGSVVEIISINNFDQRIGIQPANCPGLNVVNYWHLSAVLVSPGDIVSFGQEIGRTGGFVINGVPQPHIHYQFNRPADRSFRIEEPYIPQNVLRRDCNEPAIECGVTITSAP